MNNTVIGIAVLDRTEKTKAVSECHSEYLHILCQYADGSKHHSSLPVKSKGQPGNGWEYQNDGGALTVTPSVAISTTRPNPSKPEENEKVELFHNGAQWSVPYREFSGEGGEYMSAYDLFRSVNGLEKRA